MNFYDFLEFQARLIEKLTRLISLLEKLPPEKGKPFNLWNCQQFYDKYSRFTIHYLGNSFSGTKDFWRYYYSQRKGKGRESAFKADLFSGIVNQDEKMMWINEVEEHESST